MVQNEKKLMYKENAGVTSKDKELLTGHKKNSRFVFEEKSKNDEKRTLRYHGEDSLTFSG